MPVYEYRCTRGHQYEKTEGFDAPTRQRCPECKAVAQRQLSLPAVIFKGTGFYHTDHGRGSSRSNGSSSATTSDASIDSTPAATSSSDDHGHSHPHPHPHGSDSSTKSESKAATAAAD